MRDSGKMMRVETAGARGAVGTVNGGVRESLLARITVEPPDVLSTSFRDGALGLGHEETRVQELNK